MGFSIRFGTVWVAVAVLAMVFGGCAGDTGPKGGGEETIVQLNATINDMGEADFSAIPVAGGTLELNTALFRIDDFEYVIHTGGLFTSGEAGESKVHHEEGEDAEDSDSDSKEEEDEEGSEEAAGMPPETKVIELEGPYVLSGLLDQFTLETTTLVTGALNEVVVTFEPGSEGHMSGQAFSLAGYYTPSGGDRIPFVMSSKQEFEVRKSLVSKQYTLMQQSNPSMLFTIDLVSWLGELDVGDAEIVSGSLLIEDDRNRDILVRAIGLLAEHIHITMDR